jgi:hypothetical protein
MNKKQEHREAMTKVNNSRDYFQAGHASRGGFEYGPARANLTKKGKNSAHCTLHGS